MKTYFSKNTEKKGFTLIELLIVIAIIAILTGIIIPNLTGAKAKARDAKRVSDLGQIQGAIELFYDRCKTYPLSIVTGDNGGGSCPSGITLGTFMSKVPTAPPSSEAWMDQYYYQTDGQQYYLLIGLESGSPALQDDVDGDITWPGESVNCDDNIYCLTD